MKYLLKQRVDLKNVTDTASFYWKQTGGFCADKKMKCNKMYTVWYITAKKNQKTTLLRWLNTVCTHVFSW